LTKVVGSARNLFGGKQSRAVFLEIAYAFVHRLKTFADDAAERRKEAERNNCGRWGKLRTAIPGDEAPVERRTPDRARRSRREGDMENASEEMQVP
ncbi:hypothetical protein CSUI_007684, partial [Cystoisospora suis]